MTNDKEFWIKVEEENVNGLGFPTDHKKQPISPASVLLTTAWRSALSSANGETARAKKQILTGAILGPTFARGKVLATSSESPSDECPRP